MVSSNSRIPSRSLIVNELTVAFARRYSCLWASNHGFSLLRDSSLRKSITCFIVNDLDGIIQIYEKPFSCYFHFDYVNLKRYKPMGRLKDITVSVWHFYRDGFRNMTWGRPLVWLILLKVFILFAVLRVFFFKPAMSGMTEEQKIETVAERMTGRP